MIYDNELKEKAKEIVTYRFNSFQEIVKKGQFKGQISPDVSSEAIADIIIGTCVGICSRWRLEGYSFSVRDKTISAIQLILDRIGK